MNICDCLRRWCPCYGSSPTPLQQNSPYEVAGDDDSPRLTPRTSSPPSPIQKDIQEDNQEERSSTYADGRGTLPDSAYGSINGDQN